MKKIKYNLNKIYFYGLVLCYLNLCNNEKYREFFNKLSRNEETKKNLFEVMLKYKSFFKKDTDLSKELLDGIIKYATEKNFKTFKEDALFYLRDINTFLDILESNKDKIIKIKEFEPIEIPDIKDDEEINFGIINPKIESLISFSKEKKKLIIYLKGKFWEGLVNKCKEISKENIELCSTLKVLLNKYSGLVRGIIVNKED